MSLELAFELLSKRLESLCDEVEELRFNAADFFPPTHPSGKMNGDVHKHRPPSPVETLGENAEAVKGDLHEALAAFGKALGATRPPRDLQQAQAGLIDVSRYLNDAVDRFRKDIIQPKTLQLLSQMASELSGEWPEWLRQIKSVIYTIRDKFLEVWRALCQCWEELADKMSGGAVSVQNTNIGQQITLREEQFDLRRKAEPQHEVAHKAGD
jgi:hypothetical protein